MVSVRTLRAFAAALLLAGGLTLATALPASAHDELVSSNPAEGEQLATAPTVISLVYSADVMELGAAILVVDGEGKDWASGDVTVEGNTVAIALEPDLAEAGYQVRWRVVSSDGHPITGTVSFTVGAAEPFVSQTGATTESGTAETQEQGAAENEDAFRVVLVGVIGAIAAGGIFALILFLRRRTSGSEKS